MRVRRRFGLLGGLGVRVDRRQVVEDGRVDRSSSDGLCMCTGIMYISRGNCDVLGRRSLLEVELGLTRRKKGKCRLLEVGLGYSKHLARVLVELK